MKASQNKRIRNSAWTQDLETARRVLDLEGEGLRRLAESVDENFGRVVDCIAAVTGRVIVTGMGKSGHIGHKIAATLASTGTPAFYVHPGEASHGDLGMITAGDAVLALSNSGETPELRDLVEYARRFSIPLVTITSKPDSTLAELADVALLLPAVGEACPMGLAPTTSTTMSLALGDALAVALLERRNFSNQDFRLFHPGGRIGNSLLRVSDLMHSGDALPLVGEDAVMHEAILVMTEKRFGCLGVVGEDGGLAGIVTDGDLRRTLSADLLDRQVTEVMTRKPATVRSQALAGEAVALMNARKITNLFVVEDGAAGPTGILHIHDCLNAGVA